MKKAVSVGRHFYEPNRLVYWLLELSTMKFDYLNRTLVIIEMYLDDYCSLILSLWEKEV